MSAPAETDVGSSEIECHVLLPDSTRAESERVKELYLAKTRQLEYERAAGEVIHLDDMEDVVGSIIDTIRAGVLRLPSAATPVLVSIDSPEKIKAVLSDMVHDILTELGNPEAVTARIQERSMQRLARKR